MSNTIEARERKEILALIGIILFGFFLRLIYLGADSYWYDEANSICFTQWPLSLFHKHYNVSRPLYFLILKIWVSVFGIAEVPARFLSVLFGTLSIFAIFKLGKLMIDNKTAYIASLLMAVSFLQVLWSRTVKLYAFYSLVAILSCYYLLKFIKFHSKRDLILCSLLTSIAILTHPFSVYLLLVQAIFVLVERRDVFIKQWFKYQLFTCFAIILLICTFFLYSPFKMIYELNQYKVNGHLFARIALYFSLIVEFFMGLTFGGLKVGHGGVGFPAAKSSLPVGYFLFAIYMYFFLTGAKKILSAVNNINNPARETEIKLLKFLLLWFFIPLGITIAVNFWIPLFLYPRYFLFSHPAFVLIVAFGIKNIAYRFFKFAVIFLIIIASIFYLGNIYMVRHYETWRDIGNYVRQNIKEDDVITLIPFGQITSFWIYYKNKDKAALRYITKDGVYENNKWVHRFKDGDIIVLGNPYKKIDAFIAEDNFGKLSKEKKNIFLIISPFWEQVDNAASKVYSQLIRYYRCIYSKYYPYNGVAVQKWVYREN